MAATPETRMNARLRRLYADYQRIQDEFTGHPYVTVEPMLGDPPEAYEVTYRVRGLRLHHGLNRPVAVGEHKVRIYLQHGYPRERPQCLMATEVFHPNITRHVCLDDYWAAGERLTDVIIQIGEMIQYRNYNINSPLDAVAARWAQENHDRLPVGSVDLYQPEVDVQLLGEDAPKPGPKQARDADGPEIEFC